MVPYFLAMIYWIKSNVCSLGLFDVAVLAGDVVVVLRCGGNVCGLHHPQRHQYCFGFAHIWAPLSEITLNNLACLSGLSGTLKCGVLCAWSRIEPGPQPNVTLQRVTSACGGNSEL